MKHSALFFIFSAALLTAACPRYMVGSTPELASFEVHTAGVFVIDSTGTRNPLEVSADCQAANPAGVPNELRGTAECRYVIPRGAVEIDVTATAKNSAGEVLTSFNGPVSFKVLPGQLQGSIRSRWTNAVNGEIQITLTALHPYSEVRVWVQDAPPEGLNDSGMLLDDGGIFVDPDYPLETAPRTYATGVSPLIHFEDPTLQSVQQPDGFDSRSSPFVGEFFTVGKNPETGGVLRYTCDADPERNGEQALMVVTGTDQTGFFVTDISACRLIERTTDPITGSTLRTAEPKEECLVTLGDGSVVPIENQTTLRDGTCAISRRSCGARAHCRSYLPGTFASLFVYNFNYPEGLERGDLLFTVAGSIQEFTSTTQMVFPSWSVAEHVRASPGNENKWLQYVKPVEINYRLCGHDNAKNIFITDPLCGMSSANMKLESLESALVYVRGVTFPRQFDNCDFDGNGSVPFFCNRTDNGVRSWGNCNFSDPGQPPPPPEPEDEARERECLQSCVLQRGAHANDICSEHSTYVGFGQFVVEMAPPGPRWANLDDSVPGRITTLNLTTTAAVTTKGFAADPKNGFTEPPAAVLTCDVPTYVALGNDSVVATEASEYLDAKIVKKFRFAADQTAISVRAANANGTCSLALDLRVKLNLTTTQVPTLKVECDENDSNAERALECRRVHNSTFDVTGHLRHVQPARPRWMILPRDENDLCCHPGPEGCPTAVKECHQ